MSHSYNVNLGFVRNIRSSASGGGEFCSSPGFLLGIGRTKYQTSVAVLEFGFFWIVGSGTEVEANGNGASEVVGVEGKLLVV